MTRKLEKAIKVLETGGWNQGTYEENGNRCLVGALYEAHGLSPFKYIDSHRKRAKLQKDIEALFEVIDPEYQERYEYDHKWAVISYNDEPGRTKEEVIDLIRKAADK